MPRRRHHQWLSLIGSRRRNGGGANAAAPGLHRRLRLEPLEDRYLLAADLFASSALGAASTGVDFAADGKSLPIVVAGGFRLTTTASKAPVYRHELGIADELV